ncbi:MAG: hypothetical protein ACOY3Z_07095 [Thermodesulfobacteriota bacterium]
MGFKTMRFVSALFVTALRHAGGNPRRWLRRGLAAALVVGVGGVVALAMVAVMSFNAVEKAMASRPDLDLLALEKVIDAGTVVLSSEQRQRVRLLLMKLEAPGMSQAEREAIKQELWDILNPAQLGQVEAWKEAAAKKAARIDRLPIVWLEHLGLPGDQAREALEAVLTWIELRLPGNSAGDLLQRLE